MADLSIGDRVLREGQELVVVGFSATNVVPAVVLLEDAAQPDKLIVARFDEITLPPTTAQAGGVAARIYSRTPGRRQELVRFLRAGDHLASATGQADIEGTAGQVRLCRVRHDHPRRTLVG